MKNRLMILLFILLILTACKSPINPDTEIVYITETGTKFHKAGCQYLGSSSQAITLSEACKKGYSPCSVCKPPDCR